VNPKELVPLDRKAARKRAEKLLRQGQVEGAIEEYVRLIEEEPHDRNAINALGDLYVRTGDVERGVAQFTRVADHLFGEGMFQRAAALYKKVLKVQALHEHTLSQLAEIAARQGMLVDARAYLRRLEEVRRQRGDEDGVAECRARVGALEQTDQPAAVSVPGPSAEDDPATLFAWGQRELAAGDERKARAMLTRVLTLDPDRHDDVLRLALDLARGGRTDSAEGCVDVVADAALLAGDWQRAVGALEQFIAVVPRIPSLIKLVEVCVEAKLDEPLRAAQARLADAYLAAKRGSDARALAQHLVEVDPDNGAHVARLHQALELLGVAAAEATPLAGDTPTPELLEVDLTEVLGTVGQAPAFLAPDVVSALEAAARNPQTRTKASADLGRLYVRRGELQRGIEWLERAADGPAAAPDEGFAVLYDLADALERLGEPARALAILIELDVDARGYRDVRARIERLSRAQTGAPTARTRRGGVEKESASR
jgi:tetratricopeptide (TPR) repeat protein